MSVYLPSEQSVVQSSPEVLGIERQRKLADLLTAQAFAQPQGQMISGHYVAPSWTQQLAPIASALAGSAVSERADKQQQKLAEALKAKKLQDIEAINNAIKSGDNKLALALAAKSDFGKEFVSPLIGNIIPKAPEIMSDKDKEELRLREMEIRQRAAQHNQALAQSRVPMGYRMKSDGTLEAIPGGPADMKVQTKLAGANDVDLAITSLRDKYNKLNDLNAITNTEKSWLSNLGARASSSDIGQGISNALGTQAASARNSIAMERPKLLAAIQKATGMSAKQIDSNAELKLWLNAATDPTKDYASNMEALDNIEKSMGSLSLQNNASFLPSQSSIDAEIERRKKK